MHPRLSSFIQSNKLKIVEGAHLVLDEKRHNHLKLTHPPKAEMQVEMEAGSEKLVTFLFTLEFLEPKGTTVLHDLFAFVTAKKVCVTPRTDTPRTDRQHLLTLLQPRP